MKTLKFGPGFFEMTLTGAKRITLRKFRADAHALVKGEVFVGQFDEGYNMLLQATAATEVKTFDTLTDEEAVEDSFLDAQSAFEGMKNFYADLKKSDTVGIIRYDIASIEGVPVFSVKKD